MDTLLLLTADLCKRISYSIERSYMGHLGLCSSYLPLFCCMSVSCGHGVNRLVVGSMYMMSLNQLLQCPVSEVSRSVTSLFKLTTKQRRSQQCQHCIVMAVIVCLDSAASDVLGKGQPCQASGWNLEDPGIMYTILRCHGISYRQCRALCLKFLDLYLPY